ncbi:MAG: GNAT family N-acetyltransferase [Acidobacteria bacterium]|nr:MAG: GNAT family N-acetyltransferase [Acidobacteriota bacterium]PYY24742.1 MAG: GNAT family N-acetyltransferase [Acidobacteriota bacterium]
MDRSINVRLATLDDLPRLTEIQNHYIETTHITFDLRRFTPEQSIGWFNEHSDGKRYRILVAEDRDLRLLGYAATGRFRPKQAYETTVEISVACSPNMVGKGVGTKLYTELLLLLRKEDVHRVVAGIAQPNPASMALHQRFGFRQIGTFTEVGHKLGRFWDVTWLEKSLK